MRLLGITLSIACRGILQSLHVIFVVTENFLVVIVFIRFIVRDMFNMLDVPVIGASPTHYWLPLY
jgi:hypothetical protein